MLPTTRPQRRLLRRLPNSTQYCGILGGACGTPTVRLARWLSGPASWRTPTPPDGWRCQRRSGSWVEPSTGYKPTVGAPGRFSMSCVTTGFRFTLAGLALVPPRSACCLIGTGRRTLRHLTSCVSRSSHGRWTTRHGRLSCGAASGSMRISGDVVSHGGCDLRRPTVRASTQRSAQSARFVPAVPAGRCAVRAVSGVPGWFLAAATNSASPAAMPSRRTSMSGTEPSSAVMPKWSVSR